MVTPQPQPPEGVPRRHLLRQGKKLAYIAPAVIVALKAEPTFAASGGPGSGGGRWPDLNLPRFRRWPWGEETAKPAGGRWWENRPGATGGPGRRQRQGNTDREE